MFQTINQVLDLPTYVICVEAISSEHHLKKNYTLHDLQLFLQWFWMGLIYRAQVGTLEPLDQVKQEPNQIAKVLWYLLMVCQAFQDIARV